MEEKYAVIMAGGVGARLWPLSRESKPKQFIHINGNKPLLIQTLERIQEVVPAENCFVITNKDYHNLTQETVKNLIPEANIILEPIRKNTAACISYATLHLEKLVGKGLVCFIPVDSYVREKEDYLAAIRQAYDAANNSKKLVIIGVKPTFPSTGYGYVHLNSENTSDTQTISNVIQFKEKPDLETAKKYLMSNKYLWNSGIVVGHLQSLINGIQQFIPEHFKKLSEVLKHQNKPEFNFLLEKSFSELVDLSFDYGVLEKTKSLLAIKGTFNWYDIGSLDALSIVINQDENDNSISGNHLGIDTHNSIIYNEENENLVTTIGLSDMIIIHIDDLIVVCPKDRAQDVKKLVELAKKNGYDRYT
ncbi:MAG: mannose-1-phosphate guanylyltransferase [Anaerobacillus sp.]|uniref:mannose-1-phosphate guanylyltransferase n=1 Tax=Anaerobacillus sp. TaxID=1872506 RepID=UPI00391B1801